VEDTQDQIVMDASAAIEAAYLAYALQVARAALDRYAAGENGRHIAIDALDRIAELVDCEDKSNGSTANTQATASPVAQTA
jgi:hypothetical protein